jgi:flagellar protein FliS
MGSSAAYGALAQYRQVSNRGHLEQADPHRLIAMLLDGAIERINAASVYIQRGDLTHKVASISQTINIINGLRTSLDHKIASELAGKLEHLYDYLERRLLHANIANDLTALSEVVSLIRVIKEAWDAIGSAQPQQKPLKAHTPPWP